MQLDISKIQIGVCQIDFRRQEVLIGGVSVQVQPKVLKLLAYLIANRTRLVSKKELIEQVWERSYVSDAALTQCVTKARKLFEGEHGANEIIKTIHGRGYRFVYEFSNDGTETPRSRINDSISPVKSLFWYALFMSITVCVFALFLLYTNTPGNASVASRQVVALVPVSYDEQEEEQNISVLGAVKYIGHVLTEMSNWGVVEDKMLAEHGLVAVENLQKINKETLEELKQVMDIDAIVGIELSKLNDNYKITIYGATLNNNLQTQALFAMNFTGMLKVVTNSIVDLLSDKTNAEKTVTVISEDDFINQAFARGLEHLKNGIDDKAFDTLRIVVKETPSAFWPNYYFTGLNWRLGLKEEAASAFERLGELEKSPMQRVKYMSLYAGYLLSLGKTNEALEYIDNAAGLFPEHNDTNLQLHVLNNKAILLQELGKTKQAKSQILEVIATRRNYGLQPSGNNYNTLGGLELRMGNMSRAKELLNDAVSIFQREGDSYSVAAVLDNISLILREQNELDAAKHVAMQALNLRQKMQNQVELGNSYLSLADLEWRAGEKKTAFNYLDSASTIFQSLEHNWGTYRVKMTRAAWQVSNGHYGQAKEENAQVLAYFQSNNLWDFYNQARLTQARLLFKQGELEEAADVLQEIREFAEQQSYFRLLLEVNLVVADLRGKTGQTDAAISELAPLLEQLTGKGYKYFETLINLRLHRLYLIKDFSEQAEYHFRLASELLNNPYKISKLQAFIAAEYQDLATALQLLELTRSRYVSIWSEADQALLEHAKRNGELLYSL